MMTFDIAYSDSRFQLIVIDKGDDDYVEPVRYCCLSSACAANGRVYGIYLKGSEPVLERVEAIVNADPDPNHASEVVTELTVYDITDFPTLKPAIGTLTLTPTEFEGIPDDDDDEDDGEGDQEGDVVDVTPIP